jgi:exonuclease VII small subunit
MADFDLGVAMERLEEIEAYFQKPAFDLSEAIDRHAEALKLARTIESYLDKAETTLNKLSFSQDAESTLE